MTDYLPSDATLSPYYLTGADFDVLSLKGPDATRFLQGQLTCDVEALAPLSCTPGAALTNKGRAYALFWVLKLDDASYLLVLNPGLGDVLTGQLRKYLPFYKCQFSDDIGGELLLTVGAQGDFESSSPFVLGDLPLAKLHWFPQGVSSDVNLDGLTRGESRRWIADAMLLGHFPFTPADVELYTPQELRLDEHGYVSYTKGCYTGQEIVARMHYRGKVKKQLYRLELDDLVDATTVTLRIADGDDIGSAFKAMPLGGSRWRALAFLPVEAVSENAHPVPSEGQLAACEAL